MEGTKIVFDGTVPQVWVQMEDSGQAMVADIDESKRTVFPEYKKDQADEDHMFVKLQSYDVNPDKDERHKLLRKFVGKRVRVTIEVIGE
jgi:hypothetical protein